MLPCSHPSEDSPGPELRLVSQVVAIQTPPCGWAPVLGVGWTGDTLDLLFAICPRPLFQQCFHAEPIAEILFPLPVCPSVCVFTEKPLTCYHTTSLLCGSPPVCSCGCSSRGIWLFPMDCEFPPLWLRELSPAFSFANLFLWLPPQHEFM